MKKFSHLYKSFLFNFKHRKNLDEISLNKNNLDELFNHFGSDKGSEVKDPYSKKSSTNVGHSFGKYYEKHLKKIKEKKFNLLEIGTWKGASIASFYFYFKNADIFCIDRNFKIDFKSVRINYFNCDTRDPKQLLKFVNFFQSKNCKTFDLIIDDGSHLLSDMTKNFIFFFKYLGPGGFYVIEDYNHPKYFDYLNDSGPGEPFFDNILDFLEKKANFKSRNFNYEAQNLIFNDIESIFKYKGAVISDGKNISDIAFVEKKKDKIS